MNMLMETVCIKRWQVFILLGATGFAIGNILAKATTALGF
jgi:hypothetical protein